MLLHKLKIGNIELENNVILAPMAGITDLPFRIICKKFNPGLVCTEMVSSKALFYKDEKTKKLLNLKGEKKPISVQIFGSDEESIAYATKYVSEFANIIDINMGCPAPKVVKNGDGSKLLLDLDKAEEIAKVVVKNSKVPVTVKFRKGWNNDNIVAVDLARRLEKVGVSAITIHGRTRSDFYSGTADLEIIKRVKESVNIPVIGNGDITSGEKAKQMIEYTGVDGIMIGRASLGNPWIFRDVISYLGTGKNGELPSNKEKLKIMMEHIELAVKEKGESIAIKEMRKHIAAYTKNLSNSTMFRNSINKIETRSELEKVINEYFRQII